MKTEVVFLGLFIALTTILLFPHSRTPSQQPSLFQQWKLDHKITYANELQEIYRQALFLRNLDRINKHNARNDRQYEMGVNQFTALTEEEFRGQYLRMVVERKGAPEIVLDKKRDSKDIRVNEQEIDWRTQGAVTPVKNQGSMGNPSLYASMATFQALTAIFDHQLQTFSLDQLNTCALNSSTAVDAFTRIYTYARNYGLLTTFTPGVTSCTQIFYSYTISSYKNIQNNCQQLYNSLLHQPLAVIVDATNWSTYKSGIFTNCGSRLNHAVTLVGVMSGYWVVKNSWGTTWGEAGYIRLARGDTCGVCQSGWYPIK